MPFFKKSSLPLTIFITGACVLIIEIVATRILSPYFGNTIYTFSSIISVILAALSFGYYAGGKFADRFPSEKLFYFLIVLGASSTLLLSVLTEKFLPSVAYDLSIIIGPLIMAGALFFLPAFLLGLLSPFAIKLQTQRFPEMGIGTISGTIFFWSTFGSILGSLATGFLLIPNFGIDMIVLLVAGILFVTGVVGMLWNGVPKSTTFGLLFVFVLSLTLLFSPQEEKDTVYSYDSQYQKLSVVDGLYEGKPTRYFLQDQAPSGAMFLDSEEMVFEYTKYYELYKIMKPDLRDALIIGGGVYSIPKALLKEDPSIHVDVSEIDPKLPEISQKYFNVPDDKRLTHYIMDGRRMLKTTDKIYDLIYSDVYYSFSIPSHLTTVEFFEEAKEKLRQDGIFLANIVGTLSPTEDSLLFSEMRTFKEVFPNSYFFATNPEEPEAGQNFVFVGYKSEKKIDFSKEALQYEKSVFLSTLPEKLLKTEDLNLTLYPILTDNYSPIEYLMARLVASIDARPFAIETK